MIVAAAVAAAALLFAGGFGLGASTMRRHLDELHSWDAARNVDGLALQAALNTEAARADKYLRIARTVIKTQLPRPQVNRRSRPLPPAGPRHLRGGRYRDFRYGPGRVA